MRHYEIFLLINPDQSEQVPAMIERYTHMIQETQGLVHRYENWGRRPLAYQIKRFRKAHMVLMNIECDQVTIDKLKSAFRFNDAILRFLTYRQDKAMTTPSIGMQEEGNRPESPVISAGPKKIDEEIEPIAVVEQPVQELP